jgi:tRNA uridine 5-carbamoylmethylation protein Kti12
VTSSPPLNTRFVVILSGPAAVGKNTIARLVCRHFPHTLANIDLDKVKSFVESDPRTDFFLDIAAEVGASMTRIYLRCGLGVFIYNAFCSYDFVRPLVAIAEEMKAPCWYFKLTAPLDELLKRNHERTVPSEESDVRRIYDFDQACTHPDGIEIDTTQSGADEAARLILRTIAAQNNKMRSDW